MQDGLRFITGGGYVQLYRVDDIKNIIVMPQCEENGQLRIAIICSQHTTNYFVNDCTDAIGAEKTEEIMGKLSEFLFSGSQLDTWLNMVDLAKDCLK